MNFRTKPLVAAVSALFLGALCLSGGAYASQTRAAAQDTGATPSSQTQSVSIVLQLRNVDDLNKFINDTVDPNSPRFHQFLSVEEFARHYGPSEADIERVKSALKQAGIQVTEVYRSHMVIRTTGTTAQYNQFFATEIHNYTENSGSYIKPNRAITIPDGIADVMLTATGLDTKPKAHPMSHNINAVSKGAVSIHSDKVSPKKNSTTTGNLPGEYTVADFAQMYNVTPLYKHHVMGQGSTIGIATLATFTPADAYTYWQSVGLNVSPNKIKLIDVDGGAGTDGSGETTLDVEQSGGIAPASRVFVYDAPNTDQGFTDVFFKAAEDNRVDTLSVSWGSPEIAQDQPVLDGQHQAFLELAAQGISVFASAGDAGAYDINDNQGYYPYPGCSQTLTVDSPASDPLVVAAGGLTLPGVQTFYDNNGNVIGTVNVPKVRPWAWDYLQSFIITNLGEAVYYADVFPVGGGGGVSVNNALPFYQNHLHGTELSAPNQSLICTSIGGQSIGAPQDLADLPAGYAGRNLPDLSLNADPDTGYAEYVGGAWAYGWGGTSFVAPQLNGVAALITQVAGTRLGFLNPQLYARFRQFGYSSNSPFVAITNGDNEYWQATHSYNPASGIGALNVENLAKSFAGWGY
jgi:kumamolisin